MTALRIFVSYAHADEPFKDRLLSSLGILRRKKLVDVWHDRQIDGGADWRNEIRAAMNECGVALLLVSDAFLNSDFIQSEEMEHLWQRRQADGVRLAPIILRPCAWTLDDKLADIQAWPKDGKPIISFSEDNGERDQAWTDITYRIAGWAKEAVAKDDGVVEEPAPAPAPAASDLEEATLETSRGWDTLLETSISAVDRLLNDAEGIAVPVPPPAEMAHPSALRGTALSLAAQANPFNPWDPAVPPRFVGRTDLLRRLAQALDENRSVSIVGDWRIGKTSLLQTWRRGAEAAGRIVRMASGEGPEAVSCAAFVAAVTGQPAPDEMAADDADAAADCLAAWAKTVGPAGLPPLLLIDEADRMLTRLPHRFFERLRGMLDRVCLVLASRQEVDRIYASDGCTSPFINRLEMMRVGLLDEAAADALIAQGGELLDDDDRAMMRTWAGRHPYYLALLGRHLWDARRHGGSAAEALEIFRDEAAARLRELWRALDERSRQQLAGVLDGGAVDDEMVRRGLAVAGDAFGKVMTEWLRRNRP